MKGLNPCTSLNPNLVNEANVRNAAVNNETSESFVCDQDVSPPSEKEVRDPVLARSRNGGSKLYGTVGANEQVGGPTDLKCGEWCKGDVTLKRGPLESVAKRRNRIASDGSRVARGKGVGRLSGHRGLPGARRPGRG